MMYDSSVERTCQLVFESWMTPTRRVVGDPGTGAVLGEGLGDVGPGRYLLVVHHRGQGGDVVLVEGTQHQPLRADGDVGEGARHAPLRNLR